MSDSKARALPDQTVEMTTPDVCAVCGEPSVGLFVIEYGEKKKDPTGIHLHIHTGTVQAKLCAKHAPRPEASKPVKSKDEADQLTLF